MPPLHHTLWAHTADLVFDCFTVAAYGRTPACRRPLATLKAHAGFLGQVARHGLLAPHRRRDPEPRLAQIRHMLGELQAALTLANGVGALPNRPYDALARRTQALLRAFHHPRTERLFHPHHPTRPVTENAADAARAP